jgi:PAS domain S-box-containing protein
MEAIMVYDNAKTNKNNAMLLLTNISKNKAQINRYFNALLSADKDYGIDFKKGSFESDFVLINIDFVIGLLNDNCDFEKIDLSNFLYRIRRLDYSSVDLLIEIDNLLSAIEKSVVGNTSGQELNLINGLFVLRSTLNQIYKNAVINTSLFYELSIEKGITGFCQIDNEGKIVYANPNLTTLAEIESDSLEGIPFENFFNGNQRITVRNILLPENESQQMIQQIEWHTAKGRIVPIGLELSTVHSGPSRIGCYAKITDLTRPMAAQNRIFDELPIGIVKLDKKRSISYTNQNFRDMLGLEIDQWEGKSFESLIPDEKNLQIFEDQLERRFEGKSSQYELKLFRQDDEREISVSVSASPEMSLDGDVIGTIGIIRSIVREKMHNSIE